MRIVIDISKDRYDEIMSMDWKNCRRFFDEEIRAIHDGKVLEQEPQTGWIPISKELPKEGEEVLVWYEYFRYGDYNCMWQTYGIGWQYDGHFSVDNGGVKQRVIAWLPLPKPYKGSEG